MTSQIDTTLPVTGTPTTQSVRDNFTTAANEISTLQNQTTGSPFLSLQGGRMDGPMYLFNDPTDAMQPATKGYVDAGGSGGGGGIPEAPSVAGDTFGRSQGAWVLVAALSGATMTGPFTLHADPVNALDAVTKEYADAIEAQIVAPARSDGFAYGRENNAWAKVLGLTGGQLSGALGVGVTPPSDASTTQLAVFMGQAVTAGGGHGFNAYTDTTGAWRYLAAGGAATLRQASGTLTLAAAATGAADAAITWGAVATLDAKGNFMLAGPPVIPADTTQALLSANGHVLGASGALSINSYDSNSSQWKYLASGYAALLTQDNSGGNFYIYTSTASGAALGVINFGSPYIFDIHGNFTAPGQVHGNTVNASATIQSGNGRIISAGGGNNPAVSCWDTSANYNVGMWNPGGATPVLYFGSMDGTGMPIASWGSVSSGNMAAGIFTASTGLRVVANTNPYVAAYSTGAGANQGFYTDAAGRMILSNFDGTFTPNSANMYIQNGSITITNATAGKPGGGPWADSSDARVKKITGTYTRSLDAVMQLQPIEFSYLGNDTSAAPEPGDDTAPYAASHHFAVATEGQSFVGLDASACESVMPELVSHQKGYINGEPVDDLRWLDTGPLVYALVNAVTELGQRVAALEGKP
jgi:hypothetical protein